MHRPCTFLLFSLMAFSGCDAPIEVEATTASPASCVSRSPDMMRCPQPWLPSLQHVHRGAIWHLDGVPEEATLVGYATGSDAAAPDTWDTSAVLKFPNVGVVKVFARTVGSEDCPDVLHSEVYDVVPAYSPGAADDGSLAVPMDHPEFIGWAERMVDVKYGDAVEARYRTPDRALGPALGETLDVVSLGQGGVATVGFADPVVDGPGSDFAVFENGFGDTFLELAFVEVSSDGVHFARFPNAYLGLSPIGRFGGHDPALIRGLAGKHRAGFGTPFDLAELARADAVLTGRVDLRHITQVRVVDIVGDGGTLDSFGNPIYDPYPTLMSGGFDLEAVGVFHSVATAPCP